MATVALQIPSGLAGVLAQAAVLAGTLLLGFMLVALGTYAYKHLRGDGIEWPDDEETGDDDAVERGDEDDDWKYY